MSMFKLTIVSLGIAGMIAVPPPAEAQSVLTAGTAVNHSAGAHRGPGGFRGGQGLALPGNHDKAFGFSRHRHGGGHWRKPGFGWGGFVPVGIWGYGGDGDGYVDTIPMADQFGYFAEGGTVTSDGTSATYHYDRSYPYEWYNERSNPPDEADPQPLAARCSVELVPGGRGNARVAVRVCRGR